MAGEQLALLFFFGLPPGRPIQPDPHPHPRASMGGVQDVRDWLASNKLKAIGERKERERERARKRRGHVAGDALATRARSVLSHLQPSPFSTSQAFSGRPPSPAPWPGSTASPSPPPCASSTPASTPRPSPWPPCPWPPWRVRPGSGCLNRGTRPSTSPRGRKEKRERKKGATPPHPGGFQRERKKSGRVCVSVALRHEKGGLFFHPLHPLLFFFFSFISRRCR
jgi:hypothetical protein